MACMRATISGVAGAWWVRFRPTIVNGTPLSTTAAAASGSTQALNSAYGVRLPRSVEPPIQTISRIRSSSTRSSAAATFVSGPVAKIVTGSSSRASSSSISSTAARGSSATSASGSSGPSSPLAPCTSAAGSSTPPLGPSAPAAIGTSRMPASVQTRRALSVTLSSGALPPTVVIARRSSAGCAAASRSAIASSWPGSQSMMQGTVISDREPDDARAGDVDQPAIGQLEVGDHRQREEAERHERRVDPDALLAQQRDELVEPLDDRLGRLLRQQARDGQRELAAHRSGVRDGDPAAQLDQPPDAGRHARVVHAGDDDVVGIVSDGRGKRAGAQSEPAHE